MPSIGIADKTTLDAVKTDTTSILSNFPISGGTDWSTKTPGMSTQTLSSNYSNTLVDITGSGYLVAIFNNTGNGTDISIKVDGGASFWKRIALMSSSANASFPFFIRFETSLLVTASSTLSAHLFGCQYILD